MALESVAQEVAERVAAAIHRSGLSAAAVADRTGVPGSSLSRKLQARSSFTLDELFRLARVTGSQLAELLPGSPESVGAPPPAPSAPLDACPEWCEHPQTSGAPDGGLHRSAVAIVPVIRVEQFLRDHEVRISTSAAELEVRRYRSSGEADDWICIDEVGPGGQRLQLTTESAHRLLRVLGALLEG